MKKKLNENQLIDLLSEDVLKMLNEDDPMAAPAPGADPMAAAGGAPDPMAAGASSETPSAIDTAYKQSNEWKPAQPGKAKEAYGFQPQGGQEQEGGAQGQSGATQASQDAQQAQQPTAPQQGAPVPGVQGNQAVVNESTLIEMIVNGMMQSLSRNRKKKKHQNKK